MSKCIHCKEEYSDKVRKFHQDRCLENSKNKVIEESQVVTDIENENPDGERNAYPKSVSSEGGSNESENITLENDDQSTNETVVTATLEGMEDSEKLKVMTIDEIDKNYNIKDLKDIAKDNGISGISAFSKGDLIETLSAYFKAL